MSVLDRDDTPRKHTRILTGTVTLLNAANWENVA
jgi:hypothetical protein